MNPEFLDNMSWEMAEVYGAISDQIIINLARHFPFYVADTVPTSAFAYQAQMLAQMGQINRETVKIIRQNLLVADDALNRVLEQSIIDAVKTAEPELWEGAKRGIVQPPQRPVVAPNQMRAFQLYYQQSADKLNHVNTVMLESTRQAYAATVADIAARVQATQSALNIATGEVVTGVSSWNAAVKHATDRMKKNGITGFIDHANHHWSAEAYVAMDVRTTVFNTSRAAVWETNENWGNDLYIVSYHNGARPGCYPWQNKVISSINAARDVTDLDGNTVHVYAQSDTSYGEPAGLFGINCGHYPNPFIPGVSVVDGHVQNEEENKRSYEQSQEQRRLERRVREEKRDLEALKAQGADEQMISAQREKVKAASQDVDTFCKETGRQRHRNRESVYTQRDFPAADTYDPAEFTRDQQERIRKWYEEGGEQKAYTFGQMTPNEPPKVYTSAEEYDAEIERLRQRRSRLMNADTYDKAETDKMLSDIFKLEDEKTAFVSRQLGNIPEDVPIGYGIQTAKVTVEDVSIFNGEHKVYVGKVDVYEMPDGTRFEFKRGMNKAHQKLTPDALIKRFYDIPQELRDNGQKIVRVVDTYNPQDAIWRKLYNINGHSYATGGQNLTFYRYDGEHDMNYLLEALEHEMGHNLDRLKGTGGAWFSDSAEWADAVTKDMAHSGMSAVSDYGSRAVREDFADSVRYYYTWGRTTFGSKFPNRTALIERLLGIGGASP